MMNRLLLGSTRLAFRKNTLSSATKFAKSSNIILNSRFYSTSNSEKQQDPKSTPPPRSSNRGKIAILLALLAAGSTIASISIQKSGPKELVEPEKQKAFKNGDVSVIFVLGGPGAGKGTQCANLVKDYGFVHLSAGDLLRAEQKRPGSEFGELIAQHIRDGIIVPQEVTIALLRNAMKEEFSKGNTRFLVDGFPRKMDQAITFEDEVATSSFTLFFECPEEVMLKRLLERGKTSGRTDDNIESIKKRFRTFVETSYPVVEYFEKQDKVVKVSCDHPVEAVYAEVKKAIKDKINIDIK